MWTTTMTRTKNKAVLVLLPAAELRTAFVVPHHYLEDSGLFRLSAKCDNAREVADLSDFSADPLNFYHINDAYHCANAGLPQARRQAQSSRSDVRPLGPRRCRRENTRRTAVNRAMSRRAGSGHLI